MKHNITQLMLVYNADSTLFAAASDFVKKLTNPAGYECDLCKVTYGAVSMKSQWKEYLDSLPYEVLLFHRDEFQKQFPRYTDVALPAIVVRTGDDALQELVSADEISEAKTVSDLRQRVDVAISIYDTQ